MSAKKVKNAGWIKWGQVTAILKDRVRILTDRLEGYDQEVRRMRSNRVVIQDEGERKENKIIK